jgi:hypothetical protein
MSLKWQVFSRSLKKLQHGWTTPGRCGVWIVLDP